MLSPEWDEAKVKLTCGWQCSYHWGGFQSEPPHSSLWQLLEGEALVITEDLSAVAFLWQSLLLDMAEMGPGFTL